MTKLIHLVDGVATSEFELEDEPVTIGRAAQSTVQIDDIAVSAEHAVIRPVAEGGYVLEDQGSTNGTFVNDERVDQQPLRPNDHLRIGWTVFKFVDAGAPEPEKTARVRKTWIPGVYVTKK